MNKHANFQPAGANFLAERVITKRQRKGLSVVFIADGPITSVELFCQPIEYMRQKFGVIYSIFYERHLPVTEDWIEADLAIFMRVRHEATVKLALEMKSNGIRIINVTDDDFEELINTLRSDPTLTAIAADLIAGGCLDHIRNMALMSDHMMVFSQNLASKFAALAPVVVSPAVSGIEFYDSLPSAKRQASEQHEIRIGYAGSPTHSDDVALIEAALLDTIKREPKRVFVESIGQIIPSLVDHPNYRYFEPIVGISNYMKFQHSRDWDIAVAPLVDSPFNRSKSDNKFRSYASAGVPGIYSDVGPFQSSIESGRNGLLVSNEELAWSNALRRLVESSALRASIKKAALYDVRRVYGLEPVSLSYFRDFLATSRGIRVLVIGYLHLPTVSIDIRRPFAIMSRMMSIRVRMREVADVSERDMEWAEVVVVVRAGESPVPELVRKAKSAGKKVVFSWDDDLFAMPPDVPDLYNHYNNPSVKQSFETVIADADIVKVSTERLAETTKKYNSNIHIAPYGFDFSIIKDFEFHNKDQFIRIGYYGSPGRGEEFRHVLTALKKVCNDFDHVKVEFFGFKPKNFDLLWGADFIPYTDNYEDSIRRLASRGWDIGLAPLAMTDLCRAKLPTKYRDYAAVGAAGVYTKIECYTEIIVEEKTGLFAENTEQSWYDAIARLVSDVNLRTMIADNAKKDVVERFGVDKAVDAWEVVLRRLGFSLPRIPV